MIKQQLWTVVRWPAGSWSYGGKDSDPDYRDCEVYRIVAALPEQAVKKAQSARSRIKAKGQPFPSQEKPYG